MKKPKYIIIAIGFDGRVADSHPTKNYNQAKMAFEILARFAESKGTLSEIHLTNGTEIIETRIFEEINTYENDNRI